MGPPEEHSSTRTGEPRSMLGAYRDSIFPLGDLGDSLQTTQGASREALAPGHAVLPWNLQGGVSLQRLTVLQSPGLCREAQNSCF